MTLLKRTKATEEAGPKPSQAAGPSDILTIPTLREDGRYFPRSFNLYYKMSLSGMKYELGEQKEWPLYAVTTHTGFSKKPKLILHNGISTDSPWLALARNDGMSFNCTVSVPDTNDSQHGNITERLRFTGGWKSCSYSFAIEVGEGEDRFPERFEWRSSHGQELKDAGNGSWGYKLVRLDRDTAGVGGKRKERELGQTSDGKEVVATYSYNKMGMTLSKVASFQFLGSGATGELGTAWELMAVVSMLRICQATLEISTSSAAASSAGAVGVAVA